jgi:ribosome assembly protein 1
LLSAYLPVAESFSFARELLKKTSGNGTTPKLLFSHMCVMEEDPFWQPRSEEEREEFGEESVYVQHNNTYVS